MNDILRHFKNYGHVEMSFVLAENAGNKRYFRIRPDIYYT